MFFGLMAFLNNFTTNRFFNSKTYLFWGGVNFFNRLPTFTCLVELFWLKYIISAWHATIPLHHGIMAWHHGMDEGTNSWFLQNSRSKNPFCLKTYLGESSESDIQPNLYNQALSTILQASQNSWIFSFWKFRISDFFGSGQYLAGKTCKPKIWNAKFSKTNNSRKFGRPVEL